MKKFLSVLVTILLTIALLGTICLGIVRKNLSFTSFMDMINTLKNTAAAENATGLYHPGADNVILAQYSPSAVPGLDLSTLSLDTLSDANIAALIAQYAPEAQLDETFIQQILADEETTAFEEYILTAVVEYSTGVTTELKLDDAKIEKFVNKTIDNYEEYSGETVDRSEIHNTIVSTVQEVTPQLTTALDDYKAENMEILETIKPFFQFLNIKTFILCIAVCAVLALLLLLIKRNVFAWFVSLSIPAIISGALITIGAILVTSLIPSYADQVFAIIEIPVPANIQAAFISLVYSLIGQIRNVGIITLAAGIILCVVGKIFGKKNK